MFGWSSGKRYVLTIGVALGTVVMAPPACEGPKINGITGAPGDHSIRTPVSRFGRSAGWVKGGEAG